MAYTQNEKSTGLDTLTDVTLTQSDLHIVGDVSDSGRAKTITENLLEDYIANSDNFINELTANATFITNINTLAPSPLTTKGDIYTYSTVPARLPVGTDGQVLFADSTQSTGLRWIDLTASAGGGNKLAINTTAFSHTGDTTETTMFTVSIPAGTLGTNDAIRFYVLGSADGDSSNITFRTKYGGSTVATIIDTSGTSGDYVYSGVIIADNSATAQISSNQYVKADNITQASDGTDSVVNSAVAQDLVITMQLSATTGTVTAKGIIVEKISNGSSSKKVGVGEISDVDFFNFQLPFTVKMDETTGAAATMWTVAGAGAPTGGAYSYIILSPTAENYLSATNILPGATAALSWADDKQVIMQGNVTWGAVDDKTGWGMGGTTVRSAIGTNANGACFGTDAAGAFFTHTGTGAAHTDTSITSLASGTHVLRIESDLGHSTPQVRFYVDGSLVSTHTTNLPTGTIDVSFGNNTPGMAGGMSVVTAPSFAVEI